MDSDNPTGSFYCPRRESPYGTLKKAVKTAIENGKKTIVIDDSQYLMANEFFTRASEKGFEKFTEIGQKFWLPDDITFYFLHHTEPDAIGQIKVKTIGKMLDEKGCVEGRFTVCLLATKEDGCHIIKAQLEDNPIIKAPPEMFSSEPMEADLAIVDAEAREYWGI